MTNDQRPSTVDLLTHYRQMRAATLAAIDGLSDAQLTDPSLDGWSIKDYLAHIAFWDDIRAAEVSRISAGYDSTWKMAPEHEDAFGPIAYEARRHISLEQARWEFERSYEALLAAIESATPRALDPSLYGEAALQSTHEAAHTAWIRRWRTERGT